jgi:cell division protein FtsI (penicillin-binding protein 3)
VAGNKKVILSRVYLVYFLTLVFALLIVGKIVEIQYKEGPALLAKARKQEIKIFNIKADRGNILSARDNLLATSVPVFEIRMDVANDYISDELFRRKVDSLAADLALLFPEHSKAGYARMLKKARAKGNRYLLIHRKASYAQLKKLRTFPILRRGRNRGGLIAIQKTTRRLPFGQLAKRTIGYENKKEHLYVGLEGAYSDVLTGIDGKQIRRRINGGAWLPVHDENEVQPQNGKDIVTTLDMNLQDVAENALMKQMINHEAVMGCAVLMQVKTGDIKAIANLRYNKKDGFYYETYNMAIGEKYEPGSTFKLASVISALEDHKIKLSDTVSVKKGYAVYYGRTLRDVHVIGNGLITVRQAFEHSSNVGISKIIYRAYKKNPSRFIQHLYAMDLNKPLGLKIAGEATPYIKNPSDKKHWYLTSLPWMSVGYGLEITPLQLLTFYNAVANNGVEVKPRLVTAVVDGGRVVKKFGVQIRNPKIAPLPVIRKVQSLLEGVVLRGTAQNLKNDHFQIAGKTGTAKISENGKYIPGAYNATFVGYFPADNPQYSCIVVVNKPKHGYYGSQVAAPVFKEIADKVYATSLALQVPPVPDTLKTSLPLTHNSAWYPDLKKIYAALGIKTAKHSYAEQWSYTEAENGKVVFKPKTFAKSTVPNVKGMTAEDALYLLENMGFATQVRGRGVVYRQSLKPGMPFKKGQSITIQLTNL